MCRASNSYIYLLLLFFFFFTDTATTEIYTLSLHDALPISARAEHGVHPGAPRSRAAPGQRGDDLAERLHLHRPARGLPAQIDRKSTRLNSSHTVISYAVFCLKKKKKEKRNKNITEQ